MAVSEINNTLVPLTERVIGSWDKIPLGKVTACPGNTG